MTGVSKTFFYFQYAIGRLAVFLTVPLIILTIKLFGYRIKNLGAVRKKVKKMMQVHPGPWLICPNHLTMIDSAILAYAMIPGWQYLVSYRMLPWNVPELTNFKGNPLIVVICFLMKCIPVVRGGDRGGIKKVLAKCGFLLLKKESLMIFPEGTRSRHGRVNTKEYPYSAGRLFLKVPDVRVMCVYLRGDGQKVHSSIPGFGERFFMAIEECRPETQLKGLRAQRECSAKIIAHLAKMEEAYFAAHGK